jgi:GntR family transcriptional regulator
MDNPALFQPFLPINDNGCDNCSLTQRVAEYLRDLIMEGSLPPETQLPNEPDLSAYLKVSRSTIRSALTILEQNGFIQKRWGVGTFISKNPPTYNNLSINSGVTQLIRSSGAEPGFCEFLITIRPASEHVAGRLSLDPGDPVVVLERVRLANDRRVVFSLDIIAQKLFVTKDGEIPLSDIEEYLEHNQSMYRYLQERLGMEIHHGVARIRPMSAEDYLAEKLSIPRGSSVLHVEQVDFNNDGEPLALTDEYYDPNAFTFYIYRTN